MTEEELMLISLLDCRRIDLYVDPQPLSPVQQERLRQMQTQRQHGEPLQYVLGFCEFMGLRFNVDERVLIPRPETELLVELALEKAKVYQGQSIRILDLGTGSGNIAVSLAKYVPQCTVIAVDISTAAIDLAYSNAKANGVEHKIQFINGDMVSALKFPLAPEDYFQLVISNPPYISSVQMPRLPADVLREPRLALDGGVDGLDFYQRIIADSVNFLSPDGFLLLEMGDGQREALELLLERSSFAICECRKDFSGADRIVVMERRYA